MRGYCDGEEGVDDEVGTEGTAVVGHGLAFVGGCGLVGCGGVGGKDWRKVVWAL